MNSAKRSRAARKGAHPELIAHAESHCAVLSPWAFNFVASQPTWINDTGRSITIAMRSTCFSRAVNDCMNESNCFPDGSHAYPTNISPDKGIMF